MRKSLFALTAAIAILTSGCLTLSLHPLYTDKDVVSVPEAAGPWSNADDGGRWTFVPGDDNSFTVQTASEGHQPGTFEGWFLQLNGEVYLDLYPIDSDKTDEFEAIHFVALHSFYRVKLSDSTLTLEYIDIDEFRRGLRQGEFKIAHFEHDDKVIITAETAELQQFVTQQMDGMISEAPLVLMKE